MFATVHDISGLSGPLDDPTPAVTAALEAVAVPAAMLLGRHSTMSRGTLVAFWTTADDAARAADPDAGLGGRTGRPKFGPSQVFDVVRRYGADSREPRYAQLVRFAGPRTERWNRAVDRADEERIRPAMAGLPGFADAITLRAADGERITLVLADSVETFEEGLRRLTSTELLPGEDPADLTGPDQVELVRVVASHLPVTVTR